MFTPVIALAQEIVFETLPRYGGWRRLVAELDGFPMANAAVTWAADLAFQTLPRYGGWLQKVCAPLF